MADHGQDGGVMGGTELGRIFGKRVIVIGGGAQVGQVALGAVSEADRHNLRGERISVDTIPLVGEAHLAAAVRAVPDLPRAAVLVLAGALMGGDVTDAVRDVRARGIPVIALNMAGSVPSAADLVVSDPVQAGVMAVMAAICRSTTSRTSTIPNISRGKAGTLPSSMDLIRAMEAE